MKVIHYCQHVLGIGHFFRSLEIARSLYPHEVIMVTGGPPVEVKLPAHVTEYRLPGLRMDSDFTELLPTEENRSLFEVQEERKRLYFHSSKSAPLIFSWLNSTPSVGNDSSLSCFLSLKQYMRETLAK